MIDSIITAFAAAEARVRVPQQRTHEWLQARVGKATASRAGDFMARTRNGWAASRQTYALELIVERLTGQPAEKYISAAMQWGVDTEAEAKLAYQRKTGIQILECGFIAHPEIAMAGASPDGLIDDHALLEVKCPTSAAHIATLLGQPIDKRYLLQMQMQLACTGRQWVDWVSYDPRLPEPFDLFIQRVHRDAEEIDQLEYEVAIFLEEIEASIERLQNSFKPTMIGADR
jgi:putative phage-type endonuclease